MLTLSDQLKLIDEKKINGRRIEAKENKEELVPDKAADLVLLDDSSLLSDVFGAKMKGKSFVIVHSTTTQGNLEALDNFNLVSQKTLQGTTLSLLRKVKKRLERRKTEL